MRSRITLAVAAVAAALVASTVVPSAYGGSRDQPEPGGETTALWVPHLATAPPVPAGEQPPPDSGASPAAAAPYQPSVLDPAADVDVDSEGFFSWAALDRTTGVELSADNAAETSSTESTIKVWIVADFLRGLAEEGETPSNRELRDARRAIRDSHNGTTERLFDAAGREDVIERMIDICGLTDTHTPEGDEGWWSRTEMSARDTVRLGECVVDGRAAGPEWTDWVLEEMRNVRGTTAEEDQRAEEGFEGGRWGIIDGLPEELADQVAIKNGWTRIGRTNSWHLSCLAVTEEWVMAVVMRYPAEFSLDYGAERCASVARQLIGGRLAAPPPAEPVVEVP